MLGDLRGRHFRTGTRKGCCRLVLTTSDFIASWCPDRHSRHFRTRTGGDLVESLIAPAAARLHAAFRIQGVGCEDSLGATGAFAEPGRTASGFRPGEAEDCQVSVGLSC